MIDSVVDLVEEHVDLGGSQFSESIVERWYFARVSQRNVVVHVCLVHHHRFMILVMNNNGFLHSFTKYFISNVERVGFMICHESAQH